MRTYLVILLLAATCRADDYRVWWDQPTTNTDGTVCTVTSNIVYLSATSLPQSQRVLVVGTNAATITLGPRLYTARVTALGQSGIEGEPSDAWIKDVRKPGKPPGTIREQQ